MKNYFVNNSIKLTALDESDKDTFKLWFEDYEFLKNYDMVPAVPKNRKQIEEMIEEFYDSTDKCVFSIRLKETGELIGIAGFDEIIWASGTAFLFIGIGEKVYQSKGLGTEVLRMLLDYGFNELNFHKVQLNVIQYNEKAIKAYEKVGFIREGVYREFVFRQGSRYDMYLYGVLKSEWK